MKKLREFTDHFEEKCGNHFLYGLLTLLILLQFYVLLFSTGTYGGADNVSHFQVARYAYKYPGLFLDLWGKPVFSTLLAPFAQIGFKAAKAFNIIVFIVTLFITGKIADKLFKGSSLFVIILTAFAPVYFYLATTCLTEMLFGLVVVSAVYFFIGRKYVAAAVLISFLPFVRTEGMVLLPVFMVALILRKQYLPVLLLLTGTIFYTLVGFFAFNDILWLVHRMPYSMEGSIYGKGPLLHFVNNRNEIFGLPLVLLIVAGVIFWIYQIIKGKSVKSEQFVWFVLIAGCWITYFAAHSYVWWKGTGGSLGLIRVIGGVVPLAALTAVKSFEWLSVISREKVLSLVMMVTFSLAQLVWFFNHHDLTIQADPTDQLIEKSVDYIRFNEEGKKVFYFNPLVVHSLALDPYDTKQCNWLIADRVQPSNSMEWGDLLVWDAHFGTNEGGVTLENLEKDPYLKKLKSFYPVEKITVLGGYDYSVQVFKKSADKGDTTTVTESYERVLSFEDFQDSRVGEADGLKYWEIDSTQEFSPNIVLTPDVVKRYEILEIKVTLHYKALQPIVKDEVLLVCSAENEGKSFRYEKADLITSGQTWENQELTVKMSANIPEGSRILVYIWNMKKKRLQMERMKVEVKSY